MIKFFTLMLHEFANQSFWRIFIVVAGLNFISTVLYNHLVWSDVIYLNESGLDFNDELFQNGSKSRLLINVIVDIFSPIWLFGKLGLAAILLYFVSYIFRIDGSINQFLKILLISYLFVVFGDFIYSIVLLLYNPPTLRIDVLNYYPLSLLSFFHFDSSIQKYYFIWARINFFQILFIMSLFIMLRSYLLFKLKESFILTSSYVLFYLFFLVLWFLVSV